VGSGFALVVSGVVINPLVIKESTSTNNAKSRHNLTVWFDALWIERCSKYRIVPTRARKVMSGTFTTILPRESRVT
jgi:hypothetical protein